MANLIRTLAAVAAAVTLAGCGGVTSPSNQTSQDYSDTLTPGGQVFQTFSVSKTGEMQVTIQSLSPRPVVGFIGFAVGLPSGSVCSPLLGYAVTQAAIGQSYSFPTITKGSYCLLVGDFNSALAGSATFTVRYSHP
jgi:outer membrane lipoprotein SlyB